MTPEFAPLVRARLLALAKKRGLNTLVLNRHLSDEQKRRVRSVARRSDLRAVQLRRRACEREVTLCAVVARTPAAAEQLSRSRHVDIVVLRLRGPKPVPRLTGRYVRAASGTASARLLLLPTLRPRHFARASWRRATSAVADVSSVDLGVRPSGRSSRRAVRLFLGVLPPPPGAVVFRGDFETGNIAQWTWGAQCANTGVSSTGSWVRGTISVQSELVGQGSYGARYDLPAAANAYTACETLSKRRIGLGSDDYYGLMVRFPSDWREPSSARWGLSLAQLNFERIWGAPVLVAAHAHHIALVMQSGLCKGGPHEHAWLRLLQRPKWERRAHDRSAGAARAWGLA